MTLQIDARALIILLIIAALVSGQRPARPNRPTPRKTAPLFGGREAWGTREARKQAMNEEVMHAGMDGFTGGRNV